MIIQTAHDLQVALDTAQCIVDCLAEEDRQDKSPRRQTAMRDITAWILEIETKQKGGNTL